LNKEYSRKESANRKYSRGYTITQEERDAHARYKTLVNEYTRNKPGIFSHNVSSQYFGEMSPMTFRQGASVLASTMDQPQIFEMITDNQQDDTGISEHTRPHYPGQQPSQSVFY